MHQQTAHDGLTLKCTDRNKLYAYIVQSQAVKEVKSRRRKISQFCNDIGWHLVAYVKSSSNLLILCYIGKKQHNRVHIRFEVVLVHVLCATVCIRIAVEVDV